MRINNDFINLWIPISFPVHRVHCCSSNVSMSGAIIVKYYDVTGLPPVLKDLLISLLIL